MNIIYPILWKILTESDNKEHNLVDGAGKVLVAISKTKFRWSVYLKIVKSLVNQVKAVGQAESRGFGPEKDRSSRKKKSDPAEKRTIRLLSSLLDCLPIYMVHEQTNAVEKEIPAEIFAEEAEEKVVDDQENEDDEDDEIEEQIEETPQPVPLTPRQQRTEERDFTLYEKEGILRNHVVRPLLAHMKARSSAGEALGVPTALAIVKVLKVSLKR